MILPFSLAKYLIRPVFPFDVKIRILIGGLRVLLESQKEIQKSTKERPKIPIAALREAFVKINLRSDDNVFIHSGIGNIGIIEGGRKAVFNLLTHWIDLDKANVLFPVFSYAPTVLKYLESKPVFNVKTSPSFMGSLTQYALKQKLGERSLHPTHSVLAFGPNEKEIVSTHHFDIYPFAEKSPFYKHIELRNSKILLLGVDLESITAIHLVEDMLLKERKFPFKLYLDKIFEVKCVDKTGKSQVVRTLAHIPLIHLARKTNKFWPILKQERAIVGYAKVGNASVTLIDALKFFNILKEYALKGVTVYGYGFH